MLRQQRMITSSFSYKHSTSIKPSLSVYADYLWKNVNFFGEYASHINAGNSLIGGLNLSLSRDLDFALLYRQLAKYYDAPFANAFVSSSKAQNERGLYLGWKWKIYTKIYLSAYVDLHQNSQSITNQASSFLLHLNYRFNRKTSFQIQFRERKKEDDITEDQTIALRGESVKKDFYFDFRHADKSGIDFRWRVQGSLLQHQDGINTGIALVKDVNYKKNKWQISSRFALFNTDDYDTRQYVYERDVLYAFYIPAYYGAGLRSTLIVQYRLSKAFRVSLKLANTRYFNQESISSGLEEIEGSNKSDLRIQLFYQFNKYRKP